MLQQSSVKIKVVLGTTHMAKEEIDVFGGDKYRIHKAEAGSVCKGLRDVVSVFLEMRKIG